MDHVFEAVRGAMGDRLFIESFLQVLKLHAQIDADRVKKTSGLVYFLWDGSLCKIGHTNNLKTRLSMLSCGNPTLELIGYIESDNCKILEQRLHEQYAKKRVKGEWFKITIQQAKQVVEEHCGILDNVKNWLK